MIADKQLPAVAVAQRKDAIERLADYGVFLPERAQAYLSVFEGYQANNILAVCLALGVNPNLLQDERNIKAMIMALDLVRNKHYVPGRAFFAIPFNERETAAADADVTIPPPAGNTNSVKVLAIVFSYQLYEWNVTEHGLRNRIYYHKQVETVRNKEDQDQIIEEVVGDGLAVRSPRDRVARARFVPFINSTPHESMATWGYGIYLQDGVKYLYKGKLSQYAKGYGIAQASPKRTGLSIAEARAIKDAARKVTSNFYVDSDQTTAEVMALLYNNVAQISARAEDALRLGAAETFEDALDLVAEGKDQFAGTSGGLTETNAIQSLSPKAEGKQTTEMSSWLKQEGASVSPDIPYAEEGVTLTDDGEWTEVDQRLSAIARQIKTEPCWELVAELTALQTQDPTKAKGEQINFLCDHLRRLMSWTEAQDGWKQGDFTLSAYLLMVLAQINTTVNLSNAASTRLAKILVPSSKNKKWDNPDFTTDASSQARIHIQSIADYVYQEIKGERTGEIPGK
jgi:hypothetical protein